MDQIATAWAEAWRRPDRRALHEWARESIDLQGDYALTGPFRVDTSRHLIFPLECVLDDRVRMINELKAVQSGGSLVADLAFHHWLVNDPGPAMFTYQTDDDAEQHFLTRLKPTAERSTHAALFRRRHKKRDLYMWPGMNAYFQGANWNSLQRKSVKYQVNDEVWIWDLGMLEEAWRRTEAFRDVCTILNISQAGMMYSEWYHAFEVGRRFVWGVQCQQCRAMQPLRFFDRMAGDPERFAGVVWDQVYRSDRLDPDQSAATARYRCRHCGHEHADEPATWDRFNTSGDYICLDPDRPWKNVSIEWNALVRGDYRGLVLEYLRAMQVKARGSVEPLKKFMLKRIVQWWDESMAEDKIELETGGFQKLEGWEDEYIRFLTGDYQEGRGGDTPHIKYVCRAWSIDGRSRLVDEGRVESFDEYELLAEQLEISNPRHVVVDGAFRLMTISRECAKRGWTVMVGSDRESFPHYPKKRRRKTKPAMKAFSPRKRVDPGKGTLRAGRLIAYVFEWSNPSVKDCLWMLRHGQGAAWEVAQDVSESYRMELDSEVKKRVLDKKTGQWKYWWVNVAADKANHAWDCECEQVVCAMIAGILAFDLEPGGPADEKDGAKSATAKDKKPTAPHEVPAQSEMELA